MIVLRFIIILPKQLTYLLFLILHLVLLERVESEFVLGHVRLDGAFDQQFHVTGSHSLRIVIDILCSSLNLQKVVEKLHFGLVQNHVKIVLDVVLVGVAVQLENLLQN